MPILSLPEPPVSSAALQYLKAIHSCGGDQQYATTPQVKVNQDGEVRTLGATLSAVIRIESPKYDVW